MEECWAFYSDECAVPSISYDENETGKYLKSTQRSTNLSKKETFMAANLFHTAVCKREGDAEEIWLSAQKPTASSRKNEANFNNQLVEYVAKRTLYVLWELVKHRAV